MSIQAAKILEQRSHLVPGKLKITEHFFEVPRDYSSPASGTIQLFARSATRHQVPAQPPSSSPPSPPWLLYLQGGPGQSCRSPQNSPCTNIFVERGYQVLFLDQRGTGLSTPISPSTLGLRGDDAVQVQYLKSFRADSIIKDAEAVRLALAAQQPSNEDEKVVDSEESKKWSIIGQSFGGFCCVTYLSMFPSSLREVFITGGLPPLRLDQRPDYVYERLAQIVKRRNELYYKKFPEDIQRVKMIIRFLRRHGPRAVRLPSEGTLTPRRFLQMGLGLGMHGGIEALHETILRVSTELSQFGHVTRPTAALLDGASPFDDCPIYSLLHEAIYMAQGGLSSGWSADRVIQKQPEFDIEAALDDDKKPVYFFGEMIFPWMFDDYSELRKMKWQAEQLAQTNDWSALYDLDQLAKNKVPVYAAVYAEDMYVSLELSQETASRIGNCQTLVTNRVYHDGIRSKEDEILTRGLLNMRDDVLD